MWDFAYKIVITGAIFGMVLGVVMFAIACGVTHLLL